MKFHDLPNNIGSRIVILEYKKNSEILTILVQGK